MFWDPYFFLIIPGLLLGIWAQMKLTSTYARYLRRPTGRGLSGAEAARAILDQAGLRDVPVAAVPGHLTDHYDPIKRALYLSRENYAGRSVSAVGVAAHEAGHALQHQAAFVWLQLRMALVPATSFATKAVFIILLGGFFLSMLGFISPQLYGRILPFAVGAYAVVTIFQLITLPVEYDASRRAKERLLGLGIVSAEEAPGISRVLNAAALTYVAALVASVLELLRLFLLARMLGGDE